MNSGSEAMPRDSRKPWVMPLTPMSTALICVLYKHLHDPRTNAEQEGLQHLGRQAHARHNGFIPQFPNLTPRGGGCVAQAEGESLTAARVPQRTRNLVRRGPQHDQPPSAYLAENARHVKAGRSSISGGATGESIPRVPFEGQYEPTAGSTCEHALGLLGGWVECDLRSATTERQCTYLRCCSLSLSAGGGGQEAALLGEPRDDPPAEMRSSLAASGAYA